MSFLKSWYEAQQVKFYSHVPVWVVVGAGACKAAGRRLSWEEYIDLIQLLGGANSYTRKVLLPTLDDPAVCRLADYYMSQSGRDLGELDLAKHYGDAVQRELAPLLVKRLRELADLHEKTLEANEVIKLERLEFQHAATAAQNRATQYEKITQEAADDRAKAVAEANRLGALMEKLGRQHEAQAVRQTDELVAAHKQAADWEVQAQDLRDQMVGVRQELETERSIAIDRQTQINELTRLLARRYDCAGGPGTCEPACGGCASCLTRALEESQSELARVDGELRRRDALYLQAGERALKAERERDALRVFGAKLADYLETATEIIEDDGGDGGDEEDAADARELIAKAREILPPQPELCGMTGHSRGCDCRGMGGDR